MIVDINELVDYMSNVSLSADQRQAAETVLEGVQAELETYLNRSLEPVEVEETLIPDVDGLVYFSQTPVNEIISVNEMPPDPLPVPYVPTGVWFDYLDGGLTVAGFGPVVVKYKAGLPDHAYRFLKLEVLRIATREVTDRHDDTLGVTDLNTRAPAPPPIGITDDDRKRIDRWRRRVAV